MLEVEQANKGQVLKKHVNTIHCSNNLSLVQRKVFNALLFEAYPKLPHQNKFKIPAKHLCKLIGYNSNDYKGLKKSLLNLITTAIHWNVLDCVTGKEAQWKASAILSSAELINGACLYEYSEVMRELLFQPEVYGRIDMTLIARFKSSYGLALYENCIRYQGLKQTPWFSLESFRKLMGVFGNKYEAFKDFKKRVLLIAVEEVNRLSPLLIEPEIERRNQKVTQIRFKLTKQKEKINELQLESKPLESTLIDIFGLSQTSIVEIKSDYEESYIQEKVDLILKSDSFLKGKIRALSGYLINALKQDYKAGKASRELIIEKKHSEELAASERLNLKNQLKEKHSFYTSKKIVEYLNTLSNNDLNELNDEFKVSIQKDNFIMKYYRKDGLEHPMVRGSYYSFIKKERNIGTIISFEEFSEIFEE